MQTFRIVYSEDQFENRLTDFTDEGLKLLYPEIRLLPKYRQWVQQKWVLERLTLVPYFNKQDLPDTALSYEPIFVFEDRNGKPLPPIWPAAKLAIDSINSEMRKAGVYTKYEDPFSGLDQAQIAEKKDEELKEIEAWLFGNETDIGDALSHKEGISMSGLDGRSNKE